MSQHLLLVRGTHWDKVLSTEETQEILSRANAWFDRLIQQGKAKGGQRLASEGRIVSGHKGKTVTDGPFAESKEAVAGTEIEGATMSGHFYSALDLLFGDCPAA